MSIAVLRFSLLLFLTLCYACRRNVNPLPPDLVPITEANVSRLSVLTSLDTGDTERIEGSGGAYTVFTKDAAVDYGGRLVVVNSKSTLHIWDLRSGREIKRISHQNCFSINVLDPENLLVCASGGHETFVYDLIRGKLVKTIALQGMGHSAEVSPDGKMLAVAGFEGYLVGVNTHSWRKMFTADLGFGHVTRVSFSPDGKLIAVAGFAEQTENKPRTGHVLIFSSEDGKLLRTFTFGEGLDDVSFCGQRPIVASVAGPLIHIWNIQTGDQEREILAPDDLRIKSFSFSPNCSLIAALADGKDPRLIIWNTSIYRIVRSIRPDQKGSVEFGTFDRLAFARSGLVMISVGEDEYAHVWGVRGKS